MPTPQLNQIERRVFSMQEFRVKKTDDGKRTIVGYPAMFNKRSEPIFGMFYEQIAPGAFAETLAKDDIRALFNHDPNLVLGRNIAKTLRLKEDETGLDMEIDAPDTQVARDLIVSIDRGDVTQGSFSFQRLDDDWNETFNGLPVRTLHRVKLFDVSPVTFPAYPDTEVGARAGDPAVEQRMRQLVEEGIGRTTRGGASVELLERLGRTRVA